MKLLRFLGSKTLLVNLIIALILGAGLFWAIDYGLKRYTRHGQAIKVPELRGLSLSETEERLQAINLKYAVIDSAEYSPEAPRGSVLGQYPEAGAQVKEGREIRLTINPQKPRKVALPNMIEKTKRRALYDLESKGFVVGELEYRPYIGRDVVIGLKVAQREVLPGEMLPKGTTVDIILGMGLSSERIPVPYLRWKSFEEAREYLLERSLNLGAIIYDPEVEDSSLALVYRQNPPPSLEAQIKMGREVDLWLTQDYTKIADDSLLFQIPADSLIYDSIGE